MYFKSRNPNECCVVLSQKRKGVPKARAQKFWHTKTRLKYNCRSKKWQSKNCIYGSKTLSKSGSTHLDIKSYWSTIAGKEDGGIWKINGRHSSQLTEITKTNAKRFWQTNTRLQWNSTRKIGLRKKNSETMEICSYQLVTIPKSGQKK